MRILITMSAAALLFVLIAAGTFVGDAAWNESRLFYALAGRDTLVQDCRPLTLEKLIGDGFSPTDLEFDRQPSIGFAAVPGARTRTLASGFTFSDGPYGARVDGHLLCVVSGKDVSIDVSVDSLPRRTT